VWVSQRNQRALTIVFSFIFGAIEQEILFIYFSKQLYTTLFDQARACDRSGLKGVSDISRKAIRGVKAWSIWRWGGEEKVRARVSHQLPESEAYVSSHLKDLLIRFRNPEAGRKLQMTQRTVATTVAMMGPAITCSSCNQMKRMRVTKVQKQSNMKTKLKTMSIA
jgi:hypothetical protein